jgi:hypothetical protein
MAWHGKNYGYGWMSQHSTPVYKPLFQSGLFMYPSIPSHPHPLLWLFPLFTSVPSVNAHDQCMSCRIVSCAVAVAGDESSGSICMHFAVYICMSGCIALQCIYSHTSIQHRPPSPPSSSLPLSLSELIFFPFSQSLLLTRSTDDSDNVKPVMGSTAASAAIHSCASICECCHYTRWTTIQ